MRFSRPSTRSRLRNPMSASTSTTERPSLASAQPTFAVVVVLPTPPFPEVMTIDLPLTLFLRSRRRFYRDVAVSDARHLRHWMTHALLVRRGYGDGARDAQLHRFEAKRIDGRALVALCAGVCDAAQR